MGRVLSVDGYGLQDLGSLSQGHVQQRHLPRLCLPSSSLGVSDGLRTGFVFHCIVLRTVCIVLLVPVGLRWARCSRRPCWCAADSVADVASLCQSWCVLQRGVGVRSMPRGVSTFFSLVGSVPSCHARGASFFQAWENSRQSWCVRERGRNITPLVDSQ